MTRTFTNTGNHEVAYVILGTEHGATPISIQVKRSSSVSATLTEAQDMNLAKLMADDPEFFQTEMKVTT